MGFDPARVDAALKATNGRGLQPAMDWLFSHADDVIPAADDSATAAAASSSSSSSSSAAPQGDTPMGEAQNDDAITEAEATAQSLKCDDCGRLLRDRLTAAAEFHAVKTGHQNFSESTQAIKPLTEEEKKAKLEMLRAKLAAKKEEKRLQEIEEGKAKEKVRRTTGKELTEIKERLAEQEMRKAAEAKKREKEADRIAKEKIKAQIEADKRDRAARLEKEKLERQGLKAQVAASSAPAPAAAAAAGPRDYTEARIQLRLPTGGSLTQVFKSADLLSVVYDHVVAQTGAAAGSFKLVQAFPRKVLDDQSKSLKELGLAPSAALVVQ
ncbi:ubiquitin-related domain-containing protein [Chytriomyces sp. MP71]|nr:ubiquitin-related domain-containing protein [Chytriomyces sp. MP71]